MARAAAKKPWRSCCKRCAATFSRESRKNWAWGFKYSNSCMTYLDSQSLKISSSVVGLLKVVITSISWWINHLRECLGIIIVFFVWGAPQANLSVTHRLQQCRIHKNTDDTASRTIPYPALLVSYCVRSFWGVIHDINSPYPQMVDFSGDVARWCPPSCKLA